MQIKVKEPLLAPNKILGMDIPFDAIEWPRYVSVKYNGMRAMTWRDGFMSRSGRYHSMCTAVEDTFKPILEWADKHNLILDGEFQSNSFNTVGNTRSILAGTLTMPADFRFKCFYVIPIDLWNSFKLMPMPSIISYPISSAPSRLEMVHHRLIGDKQEFLDLIDDNKHKNLEGFMLVDPKGYYRHGRVGESLNPLMKFKYYSDPEDGKVIGMTQRQERRASVEGRKNAFGKSEAVYSQDLFMDTDIGGCMIVRLENGEQVNVPFPVGYTLEQRQIAYNHFGTGSSQDIKGQWVQFRRLNCENRDKPIAIKQVEFRDSKD